MAKKSPKDLSKHCMAEFVATLALTLGVLLSVHVGVPLATPLVAATIVGVFVYIIGSTSGAHINPAVTIGLYSIEKIGATAAAFYILSQFLGAIVAVAFCFALTGSAPVVGVGESSSMLTVAEGLGAFFLLFGISGVAHDKVPEGSSGLVVGGSLLIGILIASVASNGILNPAVAFGVGSLSYSYFVGPIVGAFVGAYVGRYVHG